MDNVRPTAGPASPGRGPAGLFRLRPRQIVVGGLLGAFTAALAAIPGLGFIPLPFSPAGHATVLHIPVILAGILEGPVVGGLVGAVFGLFSFLLATLPFFKDPLIAFGPRILIGVFAYYAYRLVRQPQARAVVAVVVGLALGRTIYESGTLLNARWVDPAYVPGFWGRLFHPLTSSAEVWVVVCGALGLAGAVAAWFVLRGRNAPPAMAAIVGTLTNTVLVLTLIVVRFKTFTPAMAFFVGLTNGLPEVILAVLLVTPVYRGVRAALDRK
ncbi:MAG: ECF transporter S component [Acidothermus cellulolyticus]|nr:ECF transporter S component [Acidothermus cellulolyticus]